MAKLIKAWKGHYTVEFSFGEETYYIENDFDDNGNRNLRIYTEQEFLLADEPEPIFRIWEVVDGIEIVDSGIEGESPAGAYEEIEEAMELGKKSADSGITTITYGW